MGLPQLRYGFQVEVQRGYEDAVALTKEALAAKGFGVLTEIDVRATMQQKLDVEFRPYAILGACNPPLAHRALTAERAIGLLLPCNVVVYAADAPGRSVVAVLDPVAQLGITGRDDIRPLAEQVRALLAGALDDVERHAAPGTTNEKRSS
jgi:uncharacterized protein (DUF302 family)